MGTDENENANSVEGTGGRIEMFLSRTGGRVHVSVHQNGWANTNISIALVRKDLVDLKNLIDKYLNQLRDENRFESDFEPENGSDSQNIVL